MFWKLVIGFASNLVALLVSAYFLAGFEITDDWVGRLIVALLFTLANSIILPVARAIVSPISWLTFGLLPVLINGILIYAVDIFSDGITINGILPLVVATIIFGMINATFAFTAKILK